MMEFEFPRPKTVVSELAVDDVDASVAFYRDFFGFTEVETVRTDAGSVWAEVSVNSTRLMFERRRELAEEFVGVSADELTGRTCLVLRYGKEDISGLYEELSKRGEVRMAAGLTKTDYGTLEFALFDPDGNIVVAASGKD